MADNVALNAGTGGDTVAADDIGGVKFPRSKIVIGADGSNDGDVSSANPLPIAGIIDLGAVDNAVLDAIAASLAGTLTVGTHAVTYATTGSGTATGAIRVELPTNGTGVIATVGAVTAITNALPTGDNTVGRVKIGDGTNVVTLLNLTNSKPVPVAMVDADGSQVIPSVDATHDSAVADDGPQNMLEAKDFDGAALPNAVNLEGDSVRAAGSLFGVQYMMLVNEDGSAVGSVTQSGTWNIGTVTTVTTCSTVNTVAALTGSGVAHDGADSGNPHKIGAKATTALSGLTLVANADRTDLMAGVDGVLITRPNTVLEDIVSGVAAITDGSSTSVIASAGAGVKIYITDVIISNSSATAVTVDIRDGAAGSVKATFPAPADTSGVVHGFKTPLPFSAATAVCADPSAAASTVTVTLVGFKSKV